MSNNIRALNTAKFGIRNNVSFSCSSRATIHYTNFIDGNFVLVEVKKSAYIANSVSMPIGSLFAVAYYDDTRVNSLVNCKQVDWIYEGYGHGDDAGCFIMQVI